MPIIDKNARLHDTTDYPARSLRAVTPNNSTDLDFVPKALWIGAAGNVAILAFEDSAAVTLVGCQAGQIIPVRAKRVLSTGTTATSIVAMI
jgi:hypothetical protein